MNITVYCGASIGNDEKYKKAAQSLGKWIAEKGYRLVYGGGSTGLMGVIADTVLDNSGRVIGVRPDFLSNLEPTHEGLTEFIRVETMTERKKIMIENGDVYIALPGGLGTLEEISEVVSWSMIGKNDNPCIFFNVDGFYDDLREQYEKMVSSGFLSDKYQGKLLFSESLDEIENFINLYKNI